MITMNNRELNKMLIFECPIIEVSGIRVSNTKRFFTFVTGESKIFCRLLEHGYAVMPIDDGNGDHRESNRGDGIS